MNIFHPNHYFCFGPKALDRQLASFFKQFTYSWEALSCVADFLKTLPLGKIQGKVSAGAFLVYPEMIFIGEGARVEPTAYIEGPCYIGEKTVVRHGAYIRGNVFCAQDCVVGHATEVKNAFFFAQAKAAHFAYVGDSILGHDCNLGAGTRLANLKLTRGNVFVKAEGIKIDSKRKKLGAIIGDRAQTGCNSVLNPGAHLAPGATIRACENAGGYIQATLSASAEKGLS